MLKVWHVENGTRNADSAKAAIHHEADRRADTQAVGKKIISIHDRENSRVRHGKELRNEKSPEWLRAPLISLEQLRRSAVTLLIG